MHGQLYSCAVLLVLLLLNGVFCASKLVTCGNEKHDYRLPEDIIPIDYDVYLHPDLTTNAEFSGSVNITLDILQPRSDIFVHSKYLTILDDTIRLLGVEDNETNLFQSVCEDVENEFLVFKPKSELAPGHYYLALNFTGPLDNGIVGFYSSDYPDENGNRRYIATSKFQPTYARRAFPCLDEPSFKSNFTVKLVRPSSEYIALSNMNQEVEEVDSPSMGLTTVTFATSVPMVTYLACFIVCDFQSMNGSISGKRSVIPLKVYATPNQVENTKYALEVGHKITEYYIESFQIDYPLPKLDMVAIPDYVSGATEHWGVITFRETNLLFDPVESSSSNKQSVANVIAHELAHMWFGNLMTLKWWDDLWLNEGFASFMEYKGVNHIHDDWKMLDQFLVLDLQPVLDLDATLSSHPIVQEVHHPDQITELFDTISYSKGASVIRMLEDFMGQANFEQGIHDFLEKFKFKNAITQDLWDSLQAIVDRQRNPFNVTDVMGTWTRQMGYPVISITKTDAGYRLTQKRFLANPDAVNDETESPYKYKWDIPIRYISNGTAPKLLWLNKEEEFVDLNITDIDWIKFNSEQIGYYRVNYEPEEWRGLQNILESSEPILSVADRASILNDAFSLGDASLLDYNLVMNLTQYLKSEEDYVPWKTVAGKLSTISALLKEGTPSAHEQIQEYVRDLVTPIYDKLTWNDNDTELHLNRLLRGTIVDLACSLKLPSCMQEAGKLFKKWLDEGTKPSPNLRSLVYKYGMNSIGNGESWDKVKKSYMEETNAQEKAKLAVGLAWVHDATILQQFIEDSKNTTFIRSQDFYSVWENIASNPAGISLVWDALRNDWEYLVDRFTLNDRYLGRMVSRITQSFATEQRLEEMLQFFDKYPNAGAGETARKQAIEKVQNNIKWKVSHQDAIQEWLQKAGYEPPTTSTVNPSTSDTITTSGDQVVLLHLVLLALLHHAANNRH